MFNQYARNGTKSASMSIFGSAMFSIGIPLVLLGIIPLVCGIQPLYLTCLVAVLCFSLGPICFAIVTAEKGLQCLQCVWHLLAFGWECSLPLDSLFTCLYFK